MSTRVVRAILPLLLLAGCYDTDDAPDEPELGTDGGVMRAPSDAHVDARLDAASEPDAERIDGGSREQIDGGAPELQVWLGFVQWSASGPGAFICGSEKQPLADKHRALLLLDVNTDGSLRAASLTLGEDDPLPEVEDPNAYYPPDPPWTWHGCPMQGLVPGFEYTAYEARLDETRLSASIRPAEVIKPWCELQPSYPAGPAAAMQWGEYLCRPTAHIFEVTQLSDALPRSDDLTVFFPEELCLNKGAPCTCDAESCTASRYRAMNLDLSVDGDIMTGRLESMELKLERHMTELP